MSGSKLVGLFRIKSEIKMSGSKLVHIIMQFAILQLCSPARAREDNDGVTAIVISRKHSCKKSKRACPARIMFLSHLICRVKGYCSFRL